MSKVMQALGFPKAEISKALDGAALTDNERKKLVATMKRLA